MSDFLGRLAERALGLAPVARPVIAPAFAPASQAEGDWLTETMVEAGGAPSVQLRPGAQPRAGVTRPPVKVSPASVEGLGPPKPTPAQPQRLPEDARALRGPVPGAPEPPSSDPEGAFLKAAGALDSATSPGPAFPAAAPAFPSAALALQPGAPSAQADPLIHALFAPAAPIHRAPAPPGRHQSATQESYGQPAHAGQADTAPPSPAVRAAGPTIRVTIGRIDVRAAQPAVGPAPAAAPRPAAPRTSLDDYLRERSKGGRQ